MDNSKFLDLVEASMPEKDLDKLMRAKRDLQVFLLNKDIKVKAKTFQDIILIELDNGQTVKLEILDITDPVDASKPVEDNEIDIDSAVANLAATANSGPKGLVGKVFRTSAQKAKEALKEREKANKLAIPVFNKATEEIEQALKKAAQ